MTTRDWLETLQTRAALTARVYAGNSLMVSMAALGFGFAQTAGGSERPKVRRAVPVEIERDWLSEIPRALPVIHRQPGGVAGPMASPVVSSSPDRQRPFLRRVESRREPAFRSHPQVLVDHCTRLAHRGLGYKFGSADPTNGGLDCSGAVLYLLQKKMGLRGVPRTASDQYLWLEEHGTLTKVRPWSSPRSVLDRLRPGDLLFWKGTYDTGRYPNVSHVMIYLGRDRKTGAPLMFGASSRKTKGRNGNGVDIYPLKYPNGQSKGRFVGFGRIPGW